MKDRSKGDPVISAILLSFVHIMHAERFGWMKPSTLEKEAAKLKRKLGRIK